VEAQPAASDQSTAEPGQVAAEPGQIPAEPGQIPAEPGGYRLGLAHGTALLLGAVLGPGVLALPHLAAAAAGPASVVAWAALVALSVPVAVTFATLGARFPDGGGVATFAARAFGPRIAAAVGWWFYAAVPVGSLAAAVIGAQYITDGLGAGTGGVPAVAGALLVVAFGVNYAGLRISGPIQLALAALLAALLVVAVLVAAPAMRSAHFTPFAPHGWLGVGAAVGVLFFAFVGWEAASHLSADFANPRRHLPLATLLTLVVVGVLYLGLAVTTIGVLGEAAGSSPVPLTLLLERGIGRAAGPFTAVAATLLTFGVINTYLAGSARLGAALARDGALPRALAKGGAPGQVPRRSLSVLAALAGVLTAVALIRGIPLDGLIRATSACLAAVTVVGLAAAIRMLPRPGWGRRSAVAATGFTAAVLVACGPYLAVPAGLGLAAIGFQRTARAVRDRASARNPAP
jgi:amino acid efflux transporter